MYFPYQGANQAINPLTFQKEFIRTSPVYLKPRKASWDTPGKNSADGKILNMENNQPTTSFWNTALDSGGDPV